MTATIIESPVGSIKLEETSGLLTSAVFWEGGPLADGAAASPALLQFAAEMMAYFDGELDAFRSSASYLQEGTAFQQKVWQQLTTIPFGKTISYRQLALQLGDEKCIRAAASANGQNQLAIIVPCHRVIGSDGSLVGYAGGLWRKKWLLEHEAKFSGKPSQASFLF